MFSARFRRFLEILIFKISGLRVLSCMSIFPDFDFLRFLVCGSFHVCRFSQILTFLVFLGSDDDDTTRHDDNTETPDPGQPPLPGTKYPVRVSPHFDNPGQKYSEIFSDFFGHVLLYFLFFRGILGPGGLGIV